MNTNLFNKSLTLQSCLGLLNVDRNCYLYDGVGYNGRVDFTTERKLNAKVVDSVLNSRTFAARTLGMGKVMTGKTYDYSVKVVDSQAGEFFTGLENLNSAASDTLTLLSFAHTGFTQPAVSIMLEAFANAGTEGTIDLNTFKLDEAVSEAIQKWGNSVYQAGQAGQPNGLGNIIDDGTTAATIGGQARATYTVLKSTVQAAVGGIISLSVLAGLEDPITGAGVESEEPSLNLTGKAPWTLYEALILPTMRADYSTSGYNKIALRGNDIMTPGELKGAAGFNVLSYRGKPVLKDDAAPAGLFYMVNERYIEFRGRTIVPESYQGKIEKVTLGTAKTMDGMAGSPEYRPPSSVGWFFQPYQFLPGQAGQVARYYCIGQVCVSQPRRQGKLTGVTTV